MSKALANQLRTLKVAAKAAAKARSDADSEVTRLRGLIQDVEADLSKVVGPNKTRVAYIVEDSSVCVVEYDVKEPRISFVMPEA